MTSLGVAFVQKFGQFDLIPKFGVSQAISTQFENRCSLKLDVVFARFVSTRHVVRLQTRFLGRQGLAPAKTPELDLYEGIGNHSDGTRGKARQAYRSTVSNVSG